MSDFLDFSGEEEQKEFGKYGPVPEGSIVFVKMEVQKAKPEYADPENPYYAIAKSGLKRIQCQMEVERGTYQGCKFFQNFTLPTNQQSIQLTQGQTTACKIGGAQLKAICEASGKPTKAKDITSLSGLVFPVKVGINQKPYYDQKGNERWNNIIKKVITPSMEEYSEVKALGEVITNGPVVGIGAVERNAPARNNPQPSEAVEVQNNIDEVPF